MGTAEPDLAALRRDLEATEGNADDITHEMLEVAAIVGEALGPLGIHPVVVGGLAVAFWTSAGQYLTSDIDVVMPHSPRVDERLAALGFEKRGRYWILPSRDVFFEAPGSYLEKKPEGFDIIVLPSGRSVRIQAPEEVLIMRMDEWMATGNADVFQQCLWLLGSTEMNRQRLEARVEEEGYLEGLKVLDQQADNLVKTEKLPESWEIHDLARSLRTRPRGT